ncbi:efflux RND transporter permease subunit [Aestuariivivens sediminis]|uniref:efflux RND transporter permease subunit n=1 Tax=Aestuariivivens sediminis TaxID=2913557 RepID=UPI001F566BDD|nr:MMPL family transporter [Aestuariivivens sediminis]
MVTYLIKYRYLILGLVIVLTLFFSTRATQIQVNADSAQYFHKNDSDYAFYERMKSEIKTEENLVILAIDHKRDVFNRSFMLQVQKLSDRLKQIKNVEHVKGLHNVSYPVNTLFGMMELPYLKIEDSTDVSRYKTKIVKDFETTNLFINQAGTALFLWIELREGLDKDQEDLLFDEINALRSAFTGSTTYLWGRKYIEFSFKKLLFKEFKSFMHWVFIFLFLALLFIFKRWQAIIFPTLVVLISIIVFLGFMVVLDKPLGMMSSIFPTIILIVGVSDVIHLAIKYDVERHRGKSAKEATHIALREIGWTTFITSITTAIGFFTLMIAPMKAMRDLGLESGIIVMFTYLLTMLLLPAFFANENVKGFFTIGRYFDGFFQRIFTITQNIQKHPNKIFMFYGALIALGGCGMFFINTNSLEYKIPRDSELKKDHVFFEDHFGGSRRFELVIEAEEDHRLNDPVILKALFRVHDYLSDHGQLHAVKSPILYYTTIQKATHPSAAGAHDFKFNEKTIRDYEKGFGKSNRDNYLFNTEKTVFKFKAQTGLLGREDVEKLNRDILNHVHQIIADQPVHARMSGMDFLMDVSQKKSINSMLLGLLLAMLVVSLTLGVIFKNMALMLLALVLNFIPLVVTAGILGFTGLELRGEISLIFTIGFVIAVDDTIHLLSKFQWERKMGKGIEEAIYIAQKECGKAILATSIILIGGFLVLIKSTTVTIATLGLFMAIIIIIALSVDLILAPMLVLTWFRKQL